VLQKTGSEDSSEPGGSNPEGPIAQRSTPVFDLVKEAPPISGSLPSSFEAFKGQDGHTYIREPEAAIPLAHRVGTRSANAILTGFAASRRSPLKKGELAEVNDAIQAWVEQYGERRTVWYRVAPIHPWPGIEIDLRDAKETRIRITAGEVMPINGSDVIFYRTPNTRAMVFPATVGNLDRLKRYVNLPSRDYLLFVAWLTYKLSRTKVSTS
jgi:hypothetical protein